MKDEVVHQLKAERKRWRRTVVLLQKGIVTRGHPEAPITDVRALRAAVKASADGTTEIECPQSMFLLEVINALFLTSVSPERGFSWLKRFLTRLSQGMGEALLNDAMQVGMNAPRGADDDEQWIADVVEHYCSQKPRRLDKANYNDDPDQPPLHKTSTRTLAANIVCHPSSFAKAAPAEEKLPMPTDDTEQEDDSTAAFAAAIIRAANKKNAALAAARDKEAKRKAAAAADRQKEREEQRAAEEQRESAMTSEEKQARDEELLEAATRERVAAHLSGPAAGATGSILLVGDLPQAADALTASYASNLRRSTRDRPGVRLNPDELLSRERAAIRESAAAAAENAPGVGRKSRAKGGKKRGAQAGSRQDKLAKRGRKR
jgi:PBP1b-binding outer membrane lipoprotein LpoB